MRRPFTQVPDNISPDATVDDAVNLIGECIAILGEYIPAISGTVALIRYNELLGLLPNAGHITQHVRSVGSVMKEMHDLLEGVRHDIAGGAGRNQLGVIDLLYRTLLDTEDQCIDFAQWWAHNAVAYTPSYDNSASFLQERIQDKTLAVMVQLEGLGSLRQWLERRDAI